MQYLLSIVKTDITKLEVDAIINAANNQLAGGGGVDGAIHKAAGNELYNACSKLNGCATGDAKITSGFNLLADYIIHTVGPVWHGGNSNERVLLKNCYISSLKLAIKNNIKSIAFPNISTGIYGFPKEEAAQIAIKTVIDFLDDNNTFDEVTFVCFDETNYNIYREIMEKL